LEAEILRKIIYATEDESQVMRILSGMRHFLRWDDETWMSLKDSFILVPSQRLTTTGLSLLAEQALEFTSKDKQTPLLVLDTASANIELENENSNSEVSRAMAILKEFYSKYDLSSQIITHLTKTAKGQSIDDLSNLSARGGGAWEGDAHWTGLLSSEKENGEGDRVLKILKTRHEHDFREISFSGSVQEAPALDRFGNPILVKYRYSVPSKSSKDSRVIERMKEKNEAICEKIKAALQSLDGEYPSKNDIKKEVGGNATEFANAWSFSETNGNLKSIDLPLEIKRKSRKNYFTWDDKLDAQKCRF
jgi:hypothetical protein